MGTGPFKYVGREPDVSFEVERFDDYFDQPLPYLDGIDYLFLPEPSSQVEALRDPDLESADPRVGTGAVLESLRRLRSQLPAEVAVLGFGASSRQLRDELAGMGVAVKDGPEGSVWTL